MKKLIKFTKYIDSINDRIGRWLGYLFLLMMILIVLEVVLRYGFDHPTIWGMELIVMIFGAITIVTGGYVYLKGGHVNVDVIIAKVPPKIQAVAGLFSSLILFFCLGILFWQGGIAAIDSLMFNEKTVSTWAAPVYPLKALWPIGAFLFLLQGFSQAIRYIAILFSKE